MWALSSLRARRCRWGLERNGTFMGKNRDLDHKIGAAMRGLRRRRSISDAEVAGRMGYGSNGRQQIDRWERGERAISASRLLLYLQAIGATFSELDGELGLGGAPSPRLAEIAQRLQDLGRGKRD